MNAKLLPLIFFFSIFFSIVIACSSWSGLGTAVDDDPVAYYEPAEHIKVGPTIFYFPPNSLSDFDAIVDLLSDMEPGEQLYVNYRRNLCSEDQYYGYSYITQGQNPNYYVQ